MAWAANSVAGHPIRAVTDQVVRLARVQSSGISGRDGGSGGKKVPQWG